MRRVVAPAEDGLHQVVHQAHARHLDAQRQRAVLHVTAEQVHRAPDLGHRQLQTHVVHELGQEGVRQRTQRVAARRAVAHQRLLVEERVEVREEASSEVGRGEDVPRGDEQFLPRRDVVRTRPQKLHDGDAHGVSVRLHALRVSAQEVGDERNRLHLRAFQVAVRASQAIGHVFQIRAFQPDHLHHQRQQRGDVRRDQTRVQLEQEHHDQRALRLYFERTRAERRHRRRRLGVLLALLLFFRRLRPRTRLAERRLHRLLHVLVHAAHELQEGFHLELQRGAEVAVQVEDHAETHQRVFFILRAKRFGRHREHSLIVRPQVLVVRELVQHLKHCLAHLVLHVVLRLRGHRVQHGAEGGEERREEFRVLRRVHHLDRIAHLGDQREAVLGLVAGRELRRVRVELAAVRIASRRREPEVSESGGRGVANGGKSRAAVRGKPG